MDRHFESHSWHMRLSVLSSDGGVILTAKFRILVRLLMSGSRHQISGESYLQLANRTFGNEAELNYFCTTVKSSSYICQKVKNRQILKTLAIMHLKIFSSCLLSRNVKTKHKL